MTDAVPASLQADVTNVEEPVTSPPRKKATRKNASKRANRKSPKRSARAASSAEVKVGDETIVVPPTLAANLTTKDIKKLRAIFKRAIKRGKKRAAKKGAEKRR